jgi:hypothetical protein
VYSLSIPILGPKRKQLQLGKTEVSLLLYLASLIYGRTRKQEEEVCQTNILYALVDHAG